MLALRKEQATNGVNKLINNKKNWLIQAIHLFRLAYLKCICSGLHSTEPLCIHRLN